MSTVKGRKPSTKKVRRPAPVAVLQLAAAEPDNEPENDAILPEEMPVEDRIRAAFGQAGAQDTATVHLYRVTQNNKPEEYLFSCGPDDLDGIMDRVRDAYGSGTYRVRVYINRKIRQQFEFSVYKPAAAVAPVVTPDNALADVLRRQNEMLERMMERLSAPAAPPPATDRLKEISELADVLKKLSPERASASALDMPAMFAMVKSGIELFRELGVGGGGDGDSDSLVGLAREVLKGLPLGDLISTFAAARAPAGTIDANGYAGAAELPSPPQPEAPPPPQPQAPASTGNALFDMLRPPVLHLVTRAKAGTSVERAAEWALATLAMDGIPDDTIAALLERPDLVHLLMTIVPTAQPYQAWFGALIDQMRAMVFEPDSEETDADAAGRPAADSASAAA